MKNLTWVLSALMVTTAASAVEIPGWERPISSATMKIERAVGMYKNAKEVKLTMNRRDGSNSQDPTSFQLTIDGQSMNYAILKVSDDCGSKIYVAGTATVPTDAESLTLIDHSHRVCKDLHPYTWEAKVTHTSMMSRNQENTLEMVGNPEEDITIQ